MPLIDHVHAISTHSSPTLAPTLASANAGGEVWSKALLHQGLLQSCSSAVACLAEWYLQLQGVDELLLAHTSITIQVHSPDDSHQVGLICDVSMLSQKVLEVGLVDEAVVPVIYHLESCMRVEGLAALQLHSLLVELAVEDDLLVEQESQLALDSLVDESSCPLHVHLVHYHRS